MIRGVHKLNSTQRRLFKSVFVNLCESHTDIKALVEHPTSDMLAQIDVPAGPLERTAKILLATQAVYRQTIPLLDMMGADFTRTQLRAMGTCRMPGITHIPTLPMMQCDQYIICPGCHYRFEMGLFMRLRDELGGGRRIGVLPIGVSLGATATQASALDQLRTILDNIYAKKWRTWHADVVCVLPRYDPAHNRWMALAVIIAIGASDACFWDPVPRIGMNTKWHTSAATVAGLARVISKWCPYSPNLLYTGNVGTVSRLCNMLMTANGPAFRVRTHGLKTDAKQEHRQIGKEIHIDTNRTGIRSRHASSPSDVAESLGNKEGFIPHITASSELLHKEPPQSTAGR